MVEKIFKFCSDCCFKSLDPSKDITFKCFLERPEYEEGNTCEYFIFRPYFAFNDGSNERIAEKVFGVI